MWLEGRSITSGLGCCDQIEENDNLARDPPLLPRDKIRLPISRSSEGPTKTSAIRLYPSIPLPRGKAELKISRYPLLSEAAL
jgi:hypothetical protein